MRSKYEKGGLFLLSFRRKASNGPTPPYPNPSRCTLDSGPDYRERELGILTLLFLYKKGSFTVFSYSHQYHRQERNPRINSASHDPPPPLFPRKKGEECGKINWGRMKGNIT